MFVWDESKRLKVLKNHKIDLALIFDIFEDASSFDFVDYEHSEEEETRYGVVGKTVRYGLVFLTYTIADNDDVRFITARRAEKWMVKVYEENRKRF